MQPNILNINYFRRIFQRYNNKRVHILGLDSMRDLLKPMVTKSPNEMTTKDRYLEYDISCSFQNTLFLQLIGFINLL